MFEVVAFFAIVCSEALIFITAATAFLLVCYTILLVPPKDFRELFLFIKRNYVSFSYNKKIFTARPFAEAYGTMVLCSHPPSMRWISTTENILVEDCFQRKMTTT
jgi:hypothetical protein